MAEQHAATTAAQPAPPARPRPPNAAERASQASLSRRQARYEEAARLHGQGVSIRRIAALLGAERKTVRGWLRRSGAPSWRKPKRGSALDPHVPLLERRWSEGCHNAAQLWREIAAAGYAGRPGRVRAWATRCRDGRLAPQSQGAAPAAPIPQPPSGRRVGRLLMADMDRLADDERQFVTRLLADMPTLADAVLVARRLHRVLRKEGDEPLRDVLTAATDTLLADFAASLARDQNAVQAALDLPWTTSPVEGQVNRIKTIKRSMYGRAGFDLLRARVLNTA